VVEEQNIFVADFLWMTKAHPQAQLLALQLQPDRPAKAEQGSIL
jgi:hypothetical protein